ncbi:MAG: M20/M25/M40 family metallo-hydrolase [Vicinamibacterales bacterium]
MTRSKLSIAIPALVIWLSLTGSAQRGQFSQDEMKRWLGYIASDALQGRQMLTEGLGLAGAYVADHLKTWGVVPAGDAGTYFQTVPIYGMRTRSNSSVAVTANGETRIFKDGDGVTFPRNQGGKQTIAADVEYVGYGLRLAELNHDDYAPRNAKGEIALFIGRGVRGMTAAQNRLITGRARDAVELHGAVGTISPVVMNAGRGRGAGPAATTNAAQRTDFQTSRNLDLPIPPHLTASDAFFEFVFAGTGHSYATLRDLAAKQEPLPAIALRDVRITITVDAEYERVQTRFTRNVVGLVRGTDAKLRDTYVAIGAHLDHVGYQEFATPGAGGGAFAACPGQSRPTARPGDNISNGADDDGSGIVSLMAIAKAFATGQKPKRSILFVWHSGEEVGLFGSRYMADYPVMPVDRMVAMLNVDMVGRNRCDDPAQAHTVYLVGSERISTELHNLNEAANASLSRPMTLDYEYNDVADPESIYTRSDHYSYASKGVPVIFFTTGLHRDYHSVTDEADRIEFAKMARIAELIHATALRVGNLERPPARDFAGPRVGKGKTGPIR